jgi:2',3'-cyclic-nucleotide 2'-phosphodiesterase (5'-nucleotidase family)
VGITGVTSEQLFDVEELKKEGLVAGDHIQSLKQVIRILRNQADIIVLLSHLGRLETIELLESKLISGIDVAVVGHTAGVWYQPEIIENTILVQNNKRGLHLGKLNLSIGPEHTIVGCDLEIIPLTEDVPAEEITLKIVEEYKKKRHLETKRRRRAEVKRQRDREKRITLTEEERKNLKLTPGDFIRRGRKEGDSAR